jgi:hypothetical protein
MKDGAKRSACAALVLVAAVAGCFSPRFKDNEIQCMDDRGCPRGFHCATLTHTCYQDGRDPVPPADAGPPPDDDTQVCADNSGCPSGYYCSLVGTCFHEGAAPARCPSYALFCDDFEGHARIPWDAPVSGGTPPPVAPSLDVTTSSSFPGAPGATFHGTRSLLADAPGAALLPNPAVYWLYWPYRLPSAITFPGVIAFRAYVYATRKPVEQSYIAYLHSNGPGGTDGIILGAVNGSSTANATWTLYDKRGDNFAFNDPGSPSIREGHWYCVELVLTLQLAGNAASTVVNMFVDDQLIANTTIGGASANDKVDQLDIGLPWVQSSDGNQFLIDDVVLAKQRIGCE